MDEFDWIREVELDPMINYPETWKGVRMNRKDSRRFKYLTYKYPYVYFGSNYGREALRTQINQMRMYGTRVSEETLDKLEMYDLGANYCMTESEVRDLWRQNSENRELYRVDMNKMPKIVNRDNKGHYNFSNRHGYAGGGNKIRYPKKNRSRRVWANFYKLFPWAAKQDGWNGKTSKRME
jgi:hypothetical protein